MSETERETHRDRQWVTEKQRVTETATARHSKRDKQTDGQKQRETHAHTQPIPRHNLKW